MKALLLKLASLLEKLPPVFILVAGIVYVLLVNLADHLMPERLTFTLFYFAGVLFVAWRAGKWCGWLVSLVTVASMSVVEWQHYAGTSHRGWVLAWNESTRLAVFIASSWLVAEVSRLTRNLSRLVDQRTAQWKAEAERHQATSASLADDIAERRRAQQQLADALELNQKILAASAMGIVVYKASGECVFANEALARIVGGTIPLILEGNFRRLDSWRQSGLLRLAEDALAQGRPLSGELHDTTRFGKSIWVDAHMAPFASGGELHLLHLAYDITERKRVETQILEISDRAQARIGQDLHDGLCQELVSLAFDANALQRKLAARSLPEAALAARMAEALDLAITESRRLSRGLFPIRLEAEGLVSALQELARTTAERYHLPCRVETSSPIVPTDLAVATHLYRIAQEAVNNAAKHGHPRTITIRLRTDAAGLTLTVEDDGLGLSPEVTGRLGGMGLHIMRYRARSIGGSLRVEAGPAGGAAVCCCVPASSG
jgi:PAS domain S-box-containing protein